MNPASTPSFKQIETCHFKLGFYLLIILVPDCDWFNYTLMSGSKPLARLPTHLLQKLFAELGII